MAFSFPRTRNGNILLKNGKVIDCCCGGGACPVPTKECEKKTATRDAVGWNPSNYMSAFGISVVSPFEVSASSIGCVEWGKIYSNVSLSVVFSSTDPEAEGYTQNGTLTVDSTAEWSSFGYPVGGTETGSIGPGQGVDNYAGGTFSGTVIYEYDNGEETFTDTYVTTLTFYNQITSAVISEQALAKLEAIPAWTSGSSCSASLGADFYTCDNNPTDQVLVVVASQLRFRWVMPNAFTGSYYKIIWDIIETPTGGAPFVHQQNQAWVRPAEAMESDWYIINPPTSSGTREVGNVRVQCQEGGPIFTI